MVLTSKRVIFITPGSYVFTNVNIWKEKKKATEMSFKFS